MVWSSGTVQHQGLTLYHTRTGRDKPPLVMLHGITDSGLCWTRTAQALEADYDCFLLDGRGHGHSDGPEQGYGLETLAQDVLAVMDQVGLPTAIVMGHSMGGAIGAYLAAHHPQRVRALMMEDPSLYIVPPDLALALLQKWQTGLIEGRNQSREAILAATKDETGLWHPLELDPWIDSKRRANPAACTFIQEPRPPWQDLLVPITCPALLLYPDALNVAVDKDLAAQIAQEAPQIQLVQVNNAGHSIRRDQFEVYMGHVRGFLKSLPD
jgi:pimeloyl-ACP methyl ester carboxylesterase